MQSTAPVGKRHAHEVSVEDRSREPAESVASGSVAFRNLGLHDGVRYRAKLHARHTHRRSLVVPPHRGDPQPLVQLREHAKTHSMTSERAPALERASLLQLHLVSVIRLLERPRLEPLFGMTPFGAERPPAVPRTT